MKKATFFAVVALCFATLAGSAQSGGVYLFIPSGSSIPVDISTGTHANEIKVLTTANGLAVAVSSSGGGTSIGKATPSDFSFTKTYSFSSLGLQYNLTRGFVMPSAEFRFYSTSGGTETLVYTIALSNVIISSVQQNGSTCTSCPALDETYTFNYRKIRWTDVTKNAYTEFDVPTNITTKGGF